MKPYKQRISKAEWRQLGGFRNPDLFRKQVGRCWGYFRVLP